MTYWLDLFNRETWQEFRDAGAAVVGFRETMRVYMRKVEVSDILLCYLSGGPKEWVGALKVLGPSEDDTAIWKNDAFPARLSVEPLVLLEPGKGVPLDSLEGHVAFYRTRVNRSKLSGFLRRGLHRFEPDDGSLILKLLHKADESNSGS